MLGATHAISPSAMMVGPIQYPHSPSVTASIVGNRQFKKHKVLPRPRYEQPNETPIAVSPTDPAEHGLALDTYRLGNDSAQPSSPRTLKHQPRRIGSGPDLPPTPPRHSRRSSENSSGLPSSPTVASNIFQTPRITHTRAPATPPNQKSPPTPDVTPPQDGGRPQMLRLNLSDRAPSGTTTADSQGSFKTAQEEPMSSEDEGFSAMSKNSRSTIRHVPESNNRIPKPEALGLALAKLAPYSEGSVTSQSGPDYGHCGSGSDWGSVSEVEQEWDHNLQRLVTVKKRPQPLDLPRSNAQNPAVIDSHMVTPTLAARAVRQMPLHHRVETLSSARGASDRGTIPSAPSSTGTLANSDARRASAISSRSTMSTVVGAILVEAPPQRQRTLRHVRKQTVLRAPTAASSSSTTSSLKSDNVSVDRRPHIRSEARKHEDQVSGTVLNSVSSGKARREVWKAGGIPVVVVPDRRSSHKSKPSREPSLRSHSSRHSSRTTTSIGAPSAEKQARKNETPPITRQSRGRSRSVSDESDQRTMDFPPAVPARSSSLSAPTSRNTSRANSLTSDSMKLHNALQESIATKSIETPMVPVVITQEDMTAPRTMSLDSEVNGTRRRLSSEHHDDLLFVKGYGSQNTPFSLASVETNGTNPVVSEALAVQMYPHQNSSVLMVGHSAKLSESSDGTGSNEEVFEVPLPTDSTENVPTTPLQPRFSLDDVDSPLRNPRDPPEPPSHPPVIRFIPATPSGMTPAHEKLVQMGNYFETIGEKPERRPSMVRRAFDRTRRHSVDYPPSAPNRPGFLTRTLSLTRTGRVPDPSEAVATLEREPTYPSPDDSPAEEDKLHPFWRPQWSSEDSDEYDGECEDDCVRFPDELVGNRYRYPPASHRSQNPQRSFSARMKRTFAILPPREDGYYTSYDWHGPERRTIGRSPSGNLRVMRHRSSSGSLKRNYNNDEGSLAVSDGEDKRSFWRSNSAQRRNSKEKRRLSLSSRLDEIQNLSRRFSEKRREKRKQELRQKISGPREVRGGVGEVIRSSTVRDRYQHHNQI